MRTVSIGLAVLWVLMMAGQAHAVCAWVLWNEASLGGRPEWEPTTAYDSQTTCLTALSNDLAWAIKEQGAKLVGDYLVFPPVKNIVVIRRTRCLPDTIDPRGLKGDGR